MFDENQKARRRSARTASDPCEWVTPAAGHLTVAPANGSEIIHLAVADVGTAWTLCALRVSRQRSTARFQDSGCWFCASIAVSTGHTTADDKHDGPLRLREWLLVNPLREDQREAIERSLTP